MAVMRIRVDDVVQSQRGTTTEADRQRTITIPAVAADAQRPVRMKVDVGDKGEALLDKMIETAEAAEKKARADYEDALRAAWAPLLSLKPRKQSKASEQEEQTSPESEQAPADQGQDAPQEQYPAQSQPYGG